jgi:uncharacterized membrane protein YkvA (DUF1232 family)
MQICKDCGKALGSNQECEACLKYLVERGTKDMDEEKARSALARGRKWMDEKGKKAPRILFRRVTLLLEMLGDYFGGTYKEIPWTTIAATAFAVVYVVNPVDLIPDFIPFAGYVDDIAVVALAVAAVEADLKKYCAHKGYSLGDYGFA